MRRSFSLGFSSLDFLFIVLGDLGHWKEGETSRTDREENKDTMEDGRKSGKGRDQGGERRKGFVLLVCVGDLSLIKQEEQD